MNVDQASTAIICHLERNCTSLIYRLVGNYKLRKRKNKAISFITTVLYLLWMHVNVNCS